MTEQFDLFDQPKVVHYALARTLELMHRENGAAWFTAAAISKFICWNGKPEDSSRMFRDAAQHDTRIISGNQGYAMMIHCTPGEIQHAADRLFSQARMMAERATAILNQYHKIRGMSASKEVGV